MLEKISFRIQLIIFKRIISSKNAWRIFDTLHIPGFGINLQRTYFPIYYDQLSERNSFSEAFTMQLVSELASHQYEKTELYIISEISALSELPAKETHPSLPYLDNYFFGILDAAVLGAMMRQLKPKKIIEIGSGISTRYMHLFRSKYALEAQIICVDPFPRVEIEHVADQVIRLPLEQAIIQNAFNLGENDILFMDGSHYVFQGNDTLIFFFNLLPNLNSGTVVHIHDIYLPYDYEQGVSQHLWSEQYILAAMLASGLKGYSVLYPTYYQSKHSGKLIEHLKRIDDSLSEKKFEKRTVHTTGFSFWMQKL